MTFLELCAGVGGFRLGLEKQGFSCVGWAEIDKYASLLYSSYFNDSRNFGDVKAIEPSTLPSFDMLVGGFPCQPFSIAGKRAGLNDNRSIFDEFKRIIRAKRPKVLLFENVKGLLSQSGGRAFAYIIASLCELGYSVQWQVFNSCHFGLPQNRERLYIVGLYGSKRGAPLLFKPTNASQSKAPKHRLKMVASINKGRLAERIYDPASLACTLKANGGGGGAKTGLYQTASGIRRLTPAECFALQGFSPKMCELGKSLGISETQLYKMAGNAVSVNVVEYIAGVIKRLDEKEKR